MEELNQLFDGLNTTESYFLLFVSVISFLFGFLIAYLLRSGRIRKLNQELKAKQKELEDASATLATVSEQMELKDADFKRLNFELEEFRAKVARLEEEKAGLYNEVLEANAEQEKVKLSIQNYLSTIESLNEQIIGLKSKNSQLAEGVIDDNTDALDFSKIQIDYDAQKNRLEAVEQRLAQLADENKSLKGMVEELKADRETVTIVEKVVEAPTLTATLDEPELTITPSKKVKDKIIPKDQVKDDLTLINGIGPFLEKKLNGIGVFTYEQISNWDDETIEQVTEEIAFFQGRIKRDKWVEQAIDLLKMKIVNPDKLKEKKDHPKNPEDLKIIEGIGPKIEKILKKAEIMNWEDLADTTPKYLENILAEAGDQYKLHDPGTWPTQARLAARGEWNLLKEYQDDLKGGREIKE